MAISDEIQRGDLIYLDGYALLTLEPEAVE